MALKINTCVAKGLKLKIKKFLGLISTFVEVTGEKLLARVGGPNPILNRVNMMISYLYYNWLHTCHCKKS